VNNIALAEVPASYDCFLVYKAFSLVSWWNHSSTGIATSSYPFLCSMQSICYLLTIISLDEASPEDWICRRVKRHQLPIKRHLWCLSQLFQISPEDIQWTSSNCFFIKTYITLVFPAQTVWHICILLGTCSKSVEQFQQSALAESSDTLC